MWVSHTDKGSCKEILSHLYIRFYKVYKDARWRQGLRGIRNFFIAFWQKEFHQNFKLLNHELFRISWILSAFFNLQYRCLKWKSLKVNWMHSHNSKGLKRSSAKSLPYLQISMFNECGNSRVILFVALLPFVREYVNLPSYIIDSTYSQGQRPDVLQC